MVLYDITKEYLDLLAMAETEELDEQTLADTFEAIEGDFEDKAQSYAIVLNELKATVDKLKEEKARLADRQKSIERNIEAMKRRLSNSMIITGKTKFKTDLFGFSIRKSKTTICDETDMDKIPEQYLYIAVTKKPNLTEIKNAILNGEKIEFAHIEEKEGVVIK